MKKIALYALLVSGTLTFSACKKELPPPPTEMGQFVSEGTAEITVSSFEAVTPDLVDTSNRSVMIAAGAEKMARVKLTIKNNGADALTYNPQHFAAPAQRVQLSSLPNEETGTRVSVDGIALPQNVFSVDMLQSPTKINPGESLEDEYLFKIPVESMQKGNLLVLVPGAIIGKPTSVYRFSIPGTPTETKSAAPAALGKAFGIDGVNITVTSLKDAYIEIENILSPGQTPLKYPFAYTTEVLLKVDVTIQNTTKQNFLYDPGHRSGEGSGLMLRSDKSGRTLKRVKLRESGIAKGQIKDAVQIKPGQSVKDSFIFQRPLASDNLAFFISGHYVGVKGLYKFNLKYNRTEPPTPDYEPYKNE